MITRNFGRFGPIVGLLTLILIADAMAWSKGPTTPGTYTDWNGDIDEVTVVQPLHLNTFSDIVVESFDTSRVPLPNPKDNTYEAVRAALTTIKPAFMEGFQSALRQKPGSGPKPARGKAPTLVIRLHITKMDPGSQAARYFGGFGAGAVKIEVVGEVVDALSHKTLIRFKQERRSGFGAFGGGYGDLFNRTARQIGGDIAGLLNAF